MPTTSNADYLKSSALIDGKSIHFYNSLFEPIGCLHLKSVKALQRLSYGRRSAFLKSVWVPRSVQKAINRYLKQ